MTDIVTNFIADLGNLDRLMGPALLFALWLAVWRQRALAANFIGGFLLVVAIAGALKWLLAARDIGDWAARLMISRFFPSGHVGIAVALYLSVALILSHERRDLWRLAPFAAGACALLVALQRVTSLSHPLGDVIGGVLIGLIAPLIVSRALRSEQELPPAGLSLMLFLAFLLVSQLFPLRLRQFFPFLP